jgi:hypothetical protein
VLLVQKNLVQGPASWISMQTEQNIKKIAALNMTPRCSTFHSKKNDDHDMLVKKAEIII